MKQKSGIFLLNKLPDISSYQQINLLKRKLNIKKIGHAGTLDPLATGLLLVLVNDATKMSDFLLNDNKEYLATMKLFIKTTTGDITGQIIEKQPTRELSLSKINQTFNFFNGRTYEQVVPIYSAVKINGKKLYNYARNNEKVTLPSRKITINHLQLHDYNVDNQTITLNVNCSKGTYIRSLIEDIAKHLETIATIEHLSRTSSGNFNLKNSKLENQISWNDLITLPDVIKKLSIPLVTYEESKKLINGQAIDLPHVFDDKVFVMNLQKDIIALYEKGDDNKYYCKRVITNV